MTDDVSQRDRCGVYGIDDGVFRRNHLKRRKRGGIVWDFRGDGTLDGVAGVSLGIDQRHVDALGVEARGTFEIRKNPVVGDFQSNPQIDRLAVAIDGHGPMRDPVVERVDLFQRRPAGIFEDEGRDLAQVIERKLLHHLDQPPMTNLVTRRKRVDIAHQLVRLTHVTANDPHKRLVHVALIRETHDRDIKPLFVNRVCICAKATPADIDNVRRASKIANQHPGFERRRHNSDVVQMACAFPRVVGDVDVAFLHRLHPDPPHEVGNGIGHGVYVPGRSGHSLR